jgi:hypothetical protein
VVPLPAASTIFPESIIAMRTRAVIRLYGALAAVVLSVSPAMAQYQPRPIAEMPLSETYMVEASAGWWNPSTNMSITSESLGILGSRIDFEDDLGLTRKNLKEMHVVFHPARKHKLRFQYIPIDYKQSTTLRRDIIFNGQRYNVGLPVISELDWKAFRYTYEYDFLSMSRGFGGFLLDLKQTNITATLRSPLLEEYTKLKAPVPSIGGIARVYVSPAVSVTGELSGIKIPTRDSYDFSGNYFDLDVYGTVNFNRNIGAQFGFRSFDIDAVIDDDSGAMTLKGFYFGAVARF